MKDLSFKNYIQDTLLRRQKVQDLTGLSRSGLYAAIKNGTFPKPVKIGLRAVAWRSDDISNWISGRTSS